MSTTKSVNGTRNTNTNTNNETVNKTNGGKTMTKAKRNDNSSSNNSNDNRGRIVNGIEVTVSRDLLCGAFLHGNTVHVEAADIRIPDGCALTARQLRDMRRDLSRAIAMSAQLANGLMSDLWKDSWKGTLEEFAGQVSIILSCIRRLCDARYKAFRSSGRLTLLCEAAKGRLVRDAQLEASRICSMPCGNPVGFDPVDLEDLFSFASALLPDLADSIKDADFHVIMWRVFTFRTSSKASGSDIR